MADELNFLGKRDFVKVTLSRIDIYISELKKTSRENQ